MRDALETKERIDRAAIKVFVERGVDGASVRDIAKEAGVSLGALYNHYKGKDELVWALFSQSWAAMGQELRLREREHDTIETQMRSMVHYVYDLFERDWELVTFTFLGRHPNLLKVNAKMANPYVVFRLAIVAAMNRGEIPRQDPDLATAMVVGAIVQTIDTQILGRIRGSLLPHVDAVANACVGLLSSAADSEARAQPSN